MLWFLLALVVAFVVALYSAWGSDIEYAFITGFEALSMGIIIAVVLNIFVGIGMSNDENAVYKLDHTTQLYALKDGSETDGKFFLVSGYVKEAQYYYYAEKTEFGIKVDKIKTSDCYLNFDNTPRIDYYVAEFPKPSMEWFGFNLYTGRTIIYVPDGSVTNEFSVDLE